MADFGSLRGLLAAELVDRLEQEVAELDVISVQTTLDTLQTLVNGINVTPVGSMAMWMTDSAPTNWLICDGSAVSRTTNALLFGVLGTAYGPGDGATTFNLPDMRGQFPRGRDAGAAVDPDAGARTDRGDGTTGDAVGTKQSGEIQSHDHPYFNMSGATGSFNATAGVGNNLGQPSVTTATGGAETRPINTNVNFIIRTA